MNWEQQSKVSTLTEEFIRTNFNKLDWNRIMKISFESFKIELVGILYHQKLSRDFILEFINKLDIDAILLFQDLDLETRGYLRLLKG